MPAQVACLFTLIMLCSCSGIKQVVKGFWTIDKIEYKKQDLFYDILSNVIIFERNKCNMPTFYEYHKIESNEQGVWEVTQEGDKYYLTIKTGNDIFAGKHNICFKKDYENKLIKMFITSDSLFVECRKGLFNFDKDNKIIDDYLCK